MRATFELVPLDAAFRKLTRSIEIPAQGHVARFIDDLFPMITDGYKGILRITSTERIGFTSLRVSNNEGGDLRITAVPVTDEAPPADKDSKPPAIYDQTPHDN